MSRFPGWRRLFRLPFHTSTLIERDVDDELRSHLERRAGELIDQGADAGEASEQALAEFGDLDYTKRYCNRMSRRTERRARRWRVMSEVSQDLGFGWRLLRRSPGFTIVVVLALALGIGANTAVFNLVESLLSPPQGITDPDRLRALDATDRSFWMDNAGLGGTFSYREYTEYLNHNRAFSGLMAYKSAVMDVGGAGETRRVRGALVSSNFFAVLGIPMALGRTFSVDEEQDVGAQPVAVISHSLWQDRFGADPDILGTSLPLNGQSFILVGVAAEGFRGHEGWDTHDVWVPVSMFREANPGALWFDGRATWLRLVGRLKPGISLARARAELSNLERRLEQVSPDKSRAAGLTLETIPPSSPLEPGDTAFVTVLFAIVGILLLIVWVNLSSLFLARLAGRRVEIAVRLALGAGRVRVLRQILSESTFLALLGGAVGLVLALWLDDVLWVWTSGMNLGEFARIDLSPDGMVLAFALLLSVASGTTVALAAARRVMRLDSVAAMKGLGGATARSSPLRNVLVVSQLSLSLALLTCTGLSIEALRASEEPMSVFEPEQVLLVSVQPSHQGYAEDKARVFYRLLQERVEDLPGVRSASLAQDSRTTDGSFFSQRVAAGDGEGVVGESWTETDYNVVAPRYFQTLGVMLLAGRDFAPGDRNGAAPVVIVNEALAHRLWPGEDPVGKRIGFRRWLSPPEVREVVGLAKDRPPLSGARPFLYFPLFQKHPWPADECELHIRAIGSPMGLIAAVQREVSALDPNIPLFHPRTLSTAWLHESLAAAPRLVIAVVGVSGVLALLLAAVALYGTISYGVSERTREIGIRMALGAGQRDVLHQVLQQGMSISLLGTGIGLLATLALNRVLSSTFDYMIGMNPGVFASLALVLTGVAIVASYIPARRAAKVDPVEALRAE